MKRTMKGFLLSESNRLANVPHSTTSLKKLYRQAMSSQNARSREYVFLLAVELGKLNDYEKLSKELGLPKFDLGTFSSEEILQLARSFEGNAEGFLEEYQQKLGKRFEQILVAYHAPETRLSNDAHVKALMRDRIVEALSSSGKTPYAMIRDLRLNKGNAYAYLRGDTSKVSRGTARQMYEYAQSAAARSNAATT